MSDHLSPSALRIVMRAAAATIEDGAENMRRSCVVEKQDWACADCVGGCAAQRLYKREMATAALLRDAAKNRKLKTK